MGVTVQRLDPTALPAAEPSILVLHITRGQVLFGHDADQLPITADGCGVVEHVSMSDGQADHRDESVGVGQQLDQCVPAAFQGSAHHQAVAEAVPGDAHLGKDDQLCATPTGLFESVDDSTAITGPVANGLVEGRGRDVRRGGKCRHGVRVSAGRL